MILSIGLASLFFVQALGQNCPAGFKPFSGSCYHFNPTRMDFFDADSFCTSLVRSSYSSSHLVSIESNTEDSWLMGEINADSEFNGRDVWIGGTQIDKTRDFVWIRTNSRFTYTNWYRTSGPTADGKCAYMDEWEYLKWGNTDCTPSKSFVCEYTPVKYEVPHPEPAVEDKMNCASGFLQNGNSCYYFIPSSLNWFNADAFCTYLLPGTSYRVHLAAIESQPEQDFIASTITANSALRGRNYWVGGVNMDQKRNAWHWAPTDANFNYLAWAPNQPDNSGKCLMLYNAQSLRWDDFTCSATSAGFTSLGFVCEYQL